MDERLPRSAGELGERTAAGAVGVETVVEATLDRVAAADLRAFVTVTDDLAREQARERDDTAPEGRGPLHGVPVGLKDLGDQRAGVANSYGCAALAGRPSPRTTAVVERLEAAGAVVVGKTNTPELGHAGITTNEHVGPTATPFDPEHNAGGSSGGSAAAVAAGLVPVAMGSDAGGSIRIPAACCGLFGLKPSFGVVPMDRRPDGFGKATHHVAEGPLTRSVADAALVLDVISGFHPRDPASVPVEVEFRAGLDRGVADLSVGYTPDMGVFDVTPAIRETVEAALDALEAAGATVTGTTVGHGRTRGELSAAVGTTFPVAVEGSVRTLEAATGVDLRETPVSETLRRQLAVAAETTTADVAATGPVRTDVFDAVEDALERHDLLAMPTLGSTAPPLEMDADAYREWSTSRVMTWPFNWTGHPVASVPAGLVDGLPVGVQLIGPRYADERVIAASAAIERERPWAEAYPFRG